MTTTGDEDEDGGSPPDERGREVTPAPAEASDVPPARVLIEALEAEVGEPVVVYWSPDASLDGKAVAVLGRVLSAMGQRPRLAFVVCSPGGDADAAHRMLGVLHDYADHVDVYVPTYAASAATMLCLGADTLHMGPLSELSPIDPQVPVDARLMMPMPAEAARRGSDGPVYVPAGVIRDFLEFAGIITTPGIRNDAVDPARLEHLLKGLNPWIIGWYERATKSARLYARQALLDHLLAQAADADGVPLDADSRSRLADRIVGHLTDYYGSHGASIGRGEARQAGLPVTDTPDPVQRRLDALAAFYGDVCDSQGLAFVVESATAFEAVGARPVVTCPACSEQLQLDPGHRHCSACGAQLQPSCPGCTAPVEPTWAHCAYCGRAA